MNFLPLGNRPIINIPLDWAVITYKMRRHHNPRRAFFRAGFCIILPPGFFLNWRNRSVKPVQIQLKTPSKNSF
jgi:hypothetical protein